MLFYAIQRVNCLKWPNDLEEELFRHNNKRTFSLSQMSTVKLASTLPWREPMEQRVQYKMNLVIAESTEEE